MKSNQKKKQRKKHINWASTLKTFVLQGISPRKWKGNPQNGRKYLQILYLIKCQYPEYIKTFYSSTKNHIGYLQNGYKIQRHFSKDDEQMTSKHIKDTQNY